MDNKELFEWELKAEREYNNALTGNLTKEKEAYLRGVKDVYKVVRKYIGEQSLKQINKEVWKID